MSKGKLWLVDRRTKEAIRRLDYVACKPLLHELMVWARPRERLDKAERIRFKRWLWWRYGPECAYCHRQFDWRDGLTIDHIQPISKGGPLRDIQNMALACKACNREKGDKWEVLTVDIKKSYTTKRRKR